MHKLSDILNGRQSDKNAQNNTVHSTPKTREEELTENFIKEQSWICKSCQAINRGTLACRNCGSPFADEELLASARKLAKATLNLENATAQNNSAAEPQSEPQSRVCPSCGSSGSGKFCENCGAPLS